MVQSPLTRANWTNQNDRGEGDNKMEQAQLEKLLAAGSGTMATVVKGEDGKQRLIVSLPINNPPVLSRSQKTLLVASTAGAQECPSVQIKGQPLLINVNAYVYSAESVKEKEEKKAKKEEKQRAKEANKIKGQVEGPSA